MSSHARHLSTSAADTGDQVRKCLAIFWRLTCFLMYSCPSSSHHASGSAFCGQISESNFLKIGNRQRARRLGQDWRTARRSARDDHLLLIRTPPLGLHSRQAPPRRQRLPTLASPSISTARRSRRPSFSSRVSQRPTRTLPPCACSLPIPPSITSVLCSLLRDLWLMATLALGFPSALMPLSSIL